jgi:hypothetical protein
MRFATIGAVVGAIGALALVGTASASADSTSCQTAGSIKLSPGLTTTPQVQNVTLKGTLSECASTESEVTSGKYVAHFKTAEAISCTNLGAGGVGAAPEESKVVLKLKPKAMGGGNPSGPISVDIQEGSPQPLTGSITSEGAFFEDLISGSITQTYTGGETCGIPPEGKKNAKKVNKGTYSGTLSIS